jgi:hypothetical protein
MERLLEEGDVDRDCVTFSGDLELIGRPLDGDCGAQQLARIPIACAIRMTRWAIDPEEPHAVQEPLLDPPAAAEILRICDNLAVACDQAANRELCPNVSELQAGRVADEERRIRWHF